MSLKSLVDNFEQIKNTSKFNEDFIKNLHEKLHEIHNDLPFLLERIKIQKFEKLIPNLHDKTENFLHIRNLKQILNHGLFLGKVHRVIKFNQNTWLRQYLDMTTDLKKKKKIMLKNFF